MKKGRLPGFGILTVSIFRKGGKREPMRESKKITIRGGQVLLKSGGEGGTFQLLFVSGEKGWRPW